MMIAAMSLFSTVIVLRLFHNVSATPPLWLQSLAFKILARVTFVKTLAPTDIAVAWGKSLDILQDKPETFQVNNAKLTMAPNVCSCSERKERMEGYQLAMQIQEMIMSIRILTRTINLKIENRARLHRQEMVWHDIARVFDRLFLVFYLVVTCVVCIVLLGIYPQTGPKTTDAI